MQFYDATNKQGICQEIDRICDSDDTSYPRVAKTSRVNGAYEEVVGKIITVADGTWQFDDTSYTDLPIGTTTLVNAQQDYAFATAHLAIERVEVKDASGNYVKLTPLDETQVTVALTEYQKSNGMPTEYAKKGNSIFLYPIPATGSVTMAAGLKVYFQRTASLFTVVSTTAADTTVPGFASPYHTLLAFKASTTYLATYKKDRLPWCMSEITRLETDMLAFYSRRTKDERPRLTVSQESNK